MSVNDAGTSARIESEKLRARAEQNRRDAEMWERGAEGERRTAAVLERLVVQHAYDVIHDLRVPRSRANADHLVIGPTGVFLIDTKVRRGAIRRFDGTLWAGKHPMRREFETVRFEASRLAEHLGVPVTPIVCFAEGELEQPVQFVDGIEVAALHALIGVLTRNRAGGEPFDRAEIVAKAEQLAIRIEIASVEGPSAPPSEGAVAPRRSARRSRPPSRRERIAIVVGVVAVAWIYLDLMLTASHHG